MFESVLVANRGEIALRIGKTLRRLGIRWIAVYSDVDVGAPHVTEADSAVRLGPAAAARSYLAIERIIAAATETGAQAVHPGYGFLAENAEFAAACGKAGLVFIGPPAEAIEAMGDKIRAKRLVAAAGVPVVPGRTESGMTNAELAAAAAETGFPVLLKPSAGGGGKGMRLVADPAGLAAAIESARREAAASFGDDTLLVERFVARPRHIEIQVLADAHGTVLHLGERECSLQRRHQKIVEEAPSPLLTGRPDGPAIRARMGQAAVDAATSVGYTGAGTVEFIVPGDSFSAAAQAPGSTAPPSGEFFFMEMNTRLQVEHPVTELVTGLDLVEQQLLVAAGERLTVEPRPPDGHAIEVRVYAEDPEHGFLPTGGTVLALREPENVRVDSALRPGSVVSSDYDPMLAKYIAHGPTRAAALRTLRAALREAVVLGVTTNIGFLQRLLADESVGAGELDTGLIDRELPALTEARLPEHVLVAAAMERALALEPADDDPWNIPGGWRIGEPAWTSWTMGVPGAKPVEVRLRGRAAAAEVAIADADPRPASARWSGGDLMLVCDGQTRRYACARTDSVLWLGSGGHTWALAETGRLAAARTERAGSGAGPVTSPMPGTVLTVRVAAGDAVTAGTPLLVVEAMKMEHTVTAPVDGVVGELTVRAGQQVALGERLAVITEEAPA